MRIRSIAVIVAAVVSCAPQAPQPDRETERPGSHAIRFEEVGASSGLDFVHVSGESGRLELPEIMGGGGGFLDYDGDGWLDVYLVQSGHRDEPRAALGNRLYRNDTRGRFIDVTEAAGVGHAGYGMGCAAGDYDNDGDVDLFVTNLGSDVLFRNAGDGTFEDVSEAAGVAGGGWSTSATFADHDADGDLDLFVARYVDWREGPGFTARRCVAVTGVPDYCSPRVYDAPSTAVLYRNDGNGRFTDISAASGIASRAGTGLGVLATDLNDDGLTDYYVANDQMPSFAWIQSEHGTFEERAAVLGLAVSGTGRSQAGMGVAAIDFDEDLDLDVWKVHLYLEGHVLYRRESGWFDDVTARFALSAATRPFTGFGTGWHDFDLDGALEAFVANGRVQVVPIPTGAADPYAERDQVLARGEDGRYEDVTDSAGPALALVENGRAAAFADYDNDGDVDVLVVNRNGPARIYRNDSTRRGNFLSVRVLDVNGRDAVGATVRGTAGARTLVREASPGYSYLATNDPRVHLGLGTTSRVDRIEVDWVTGGTEVFGPFEGGRLVELRQGQGRAEPR